MDRPLRAKRRRKGKVRWGRLIVALLLLVLFLGGAIWGAVSLYQWGHAQWVASSQEDNGNAVVLEETKKEKPPTEPVVQQALDKPIYVLVIGKDQQSPAQADTVFLVSLNTEDTMVNIIGIPGNSKIDNRHTADSQMLNDMYRLGGLELTRAVVEDLFHIKIPYYIIMDKSAFERIAGTYGPEDFYVERYMTHVDERGQRDIELLQGYQPMNESQAYAYVRYLDDERNGFKRTQRQERWMKAFLENAKEAFFLNRALQVWSVWDGLETNISTWDAMKLSMKLSDIEPKQMNYFIVPGLTERIDGTVYWTINPTELQQLVGITLGNVPVNTNVSVSSDGKGPSSVTEATDAKETAEGRSTGRKEAFPVDNGTKKQEGI